MGQRELVRLRKGTERLISAYQEDLLSLDVLRSRMPELRQRERAAQAELHSLSSQENEKATYLRLVETVSSFFAPLRETAIPFAAQVVASARARYGINALNAPRLLATLRSC